MIKPLLAAIILTFAGLACQTPQEQQPTLQGAWEPERYLLKDGSEHPVTGLIFFAEHDWSVLFFVTNENATPLRGSGEGGTYTVHGDTLIFTHRYHLSGGHAAGSLPESPLRFEIREAAEAPRETCIIDLREDSLKVFFPSGNAMTFHRRRSGSTR
ncbi:MAG: hypothetical protein ACE5G0_03995 [Rhodothermales bacterium]